MEGYAFKMGEEGLGYYNDEYQREEGPKADPWDGLWQFTERARGVHHATPRTVIIARGKVYWGTDFQKHIVGGVSDLQRIDETRFSVSAKEGLRFATLESFQLLRWDTHPEEMLWLPRCFQHECTFFIHCFGKAPSSHGELCAACSMINLQG